jgi:hypothetical protein
VRYTNRILPKRLKKTRSPFRVVAQLSGAASQCEAICWLTFEATSYPPANGTESTVQVLLYSSPSRYVLSIYELQKIVRAFRQPLEGYIDRLWKEHDPGLMEGHAVLRYTAHSLDKALDRFAAGFKSKAIKFSRDSAISCFIGVLYGEHYSDMDAFEPRRVNAWCRARRNSHPPRPTSARP